ncbi:MAG: hypothetical protein COU81_00480 [Candidatus Portnoybacteria bacterium CG10_big_fil_rev_8_21_14_0_10_36_7]|uniref:histidine kinase n=1 Tax=Candidatus Portnoybacteria bacterium CG10_big_fil_rev_8_21_14_0_10_36_7 TaxID=1974812 RepID=A0A2M8KEY5_9BACT|nr:MAG: hypothetical protein COU81_00480 [Candidatus Portnoybacteria bacterium CG10_big_fil_rev_8_21_14_0_10_36_7]
MANSSSLTLNIFKQCRIRAVPLWQCPQFLFLVMGVINIASMILAYVFGRDLLSVEFVIVIVVSIAIVLLFLSYIITRNFEKLMELNQMKTEFISIISHQLRTPLSATRWAVSTMLAGGQTEEDKLSYLALLKENNDRMVRLLNDLLLVARIEQGRVDFKPQKFLMQDVAAQVVNNFKNYAKANNVNIVVEGGDENCLVMADPEYIKLVIQNLVDNSVRYIVKKGQVTVKTFLKRGNVVCAVKDTGVGIPLSDQNQIFQKFFRSKNVMRYQTEGTGLGLFIAKAIIEFSGGKMYFKSKENQGSIFYFTLPIAKK